MTSPVPRKPWDISWVLQGDRVREHQDSLDLPPVSWGSPRLNRDAPQDRLHQLNGTWNLGHLGAGGRGHPRDRGSSFHSLADLEDSEELTDLPATSPEVEPTRQLPDPASSNRPISRTAVLARPSRLVRGRPSNQAVLLPMPIYTPVYYQPRPSLTLWTRQTPVSGGTGLRVTADCPRTRPGWFEDFNREVGGQSRRSSSTQDWPGYLGGETPEEDCPRGGSAEAWPRSTRTRLTCPPRPGLVWREEVTSWAASPGQVTQARLKSESYC